jgi:nucleotide-binding universal stress UspA family protein
VSAAEVIGIVAVALIGGLAVGWWLPPHGRRPVVQRGAAVRHILLPFTGTTISRRALEAAVRLAKAENAVIMPAFLARVPRQLPLDTALPRQCEAGMPLLEALEQRASARGVAVDSRVARGRTYRDALNRLMEAEHFDRIIVSATSEPRNGLSIRDLEWLLQKAPAEIMILRPAPTDERRITATNGLNGHF